MEMLAADFIALFASLVLGMSLYGLVSPRPLLALVGKTIDSGTGWLLAIGVRLVFGTALLLSAQLSVWPPFFRVVGVLSIVAAFVILFIGTKRILSLVAWIEQRSDAVLRAWLLLGAGFGLLLIYCMHPAFI